MSSTDVDNYYCSNCDFEWGGHGRSPPYAFCPDCEKAPVLRQGYPDE